MAVLENIMYEGDNNVLVAKVDVPDIKNKSSIIVHESQEAVFFKDGQALDSFGAGRHEINSESIPIFKRIFKHLFGTQVVIPCSVYYVNKVNVMEMRWGTPSRIPLMDPVYQLMVNIGANGTMGVRIVDPRKFVVKIVGQLPSVSADDIRRQIKGVMVTQIKTCIAKAIKEGRVSVLDIQTELLSLSDTIRVLVNERIIDECGVELINFYIETIEPLDSDLAVLKQRQEKMMSSMADTDIEAYRTERMGVAQGRSRAAQGYTYQDERKFDVLQSAAQNEGMAGTYMGVGMGAGMGFGMGAGLGMGMTNLATQTLGTVDESTAKVAAATVKCPACGAEIPANSKFCPECGQKAPEKNKCPNCGAMVPENSKFCPECGQKMSPAEKFCPECGAKIEPGAKFCPECGCRVETFKGGN